MRNLNGLLFFRILSAAICSAVVLSLCAWIIQSSRYFSLLNTNNVPIETFTKFISYLSIDIIAVVLPIALSVSVAFVFYRFVKSRQLIALQSIGVSPMRLLQPVLSVLTLIIGYLYLSNMYISPMAWTKFRNLEFTIRNNITLPENSGALFTNNEISIYSQKYAGDFVFENILIIDSRDKTKKSIFLARSGTLKNHLLILRDGECIEIDKQKHSKSVARFKSYTHDLSRLLTSYRRAAQPNEKFIHELLSDIEDESIPLQNKSDERAMLHQKITSPLLSIIFALLTFTAAVLAPYSRTGSIKRIAAAFVLIIAIQGIYFWIANSAASNEIFIYANYTLVFAALLGEVILLLTGRKS